MLNMWTQIVPKHMGFLNVLDGICLNVSEISNMVEIFLIRRVSKHTGFLHIFEYRKLFNRFDL